MKLKVIGWVWYEDTTYGGGEVDYASYNAILDDVKEHGYRFTGFHHQEMFDCVPVLNDGKMRRFSQRSWGGLMAAAEGLKGRYAYSAYAFYSPFNENDDFVTPKDCDVDESLIRTPEELRDEYRIGIRIDSLRRIAEREGKFKLPDLDEYRYMAVNDVIVFLNKGDEYRYRITHIEKKKKLAERDIFKYRTLSLTQASEEEVKRIEEKFENAPSEIHLLLEPIE